MKQLLIRSFIFVRSFWELFIRYLRRYVASITGIILDTSKMTPGVPRVDLQINGIRNVYLFAAVDAGPDAAERHAQHFFESILQIRNQRIRIKFQDTEGTVEVPLQFFDRFVKESENRDFTVTAEDLSDDNPDVDPADQNATTANESIGEERYSLLSARMAEFCMKYLTFEYRSSSSVWVPVTAKKQKLQSQIKSLLEKVYEKLEVNGCPPKETTLKKIKRWIYNHRMNSNAASLGYNPIGNEAFEWDSALDKQEWNMTYSAARRRNEAVQLPSAAQLPSPPHTGAQGRRLPGVSDDNIAGQEEIAAHPTQTIQLPAAGAVYNDLGISAAALEAEEIFRATAATAGGRSTNTPTTRAPAKQACELAEAVKTWLNAQSTAEEDKNKCQELLRELDANKRELMIPRERPRRESLITGILALAGQSGTYERITPPSPVPPRFLVG